MLKMVFLFIYFNSCEFRMIDERIPDTEFDNSVIKIFGLFIRNITRLQEKIV